MIIIYCTYVIKIFFTQISCIKLIKIILMKIIYYKQMQVAIAIPLRHVYDVSFNLCKLPKFSWHGFILSVLTNLSPYFLMTRQRSFFFVFRFRTVFSDIIIRIIGVCVRLCRNTYIIILYSYIIIVVSGVNNKCFKQPEVCIQQVSYVIYVPMN